MKTTIVLEEFPRRKRWMRGTIAKERSLRIKDNLLHDELSFIISHWFCKYFDVDDASIHFIYILSNRNAEDRITFFIHNLYVYDLRIIHLRAHKKLDPSFIKLKISFKRHDHKYYDHMKILTRISF